MDSDAQPSVPTHPWTTPLAVSEHEVVRGFGTVVPSVLAGFALATIATLVTASDPPPLASWAAAGLVISASAMIYAMQILITALRYWSSPAERLAWRPEAAEQPEFLREERWRHALDQAVFNRYARRGRVWYNVGIVSFSVSFVLILVPEPLLGPASDASWLVVATAVVGLLGELLLVLGAYIPVLRPLVWPDPRESQKQVASTWKE